MSLIPPRSRKRAVAGILLLLAIALTVSCSPFYVTRAAYEEGKILLLRRDIAAVIADPTTSSEERKKLELVLAARAYAATMSLLPGESFTKYTRVKRDVLAWVLAASRPDAFRLHTWWFPIVGSVPYKGFFEKEDAECEARRLELKGYESWLRGTEAFSTLGWFNDPVLSTTIRHSEVRIVNTVIHETVHRTVWIPGHVDFNESLANFVGSRAAIDFFSHRSETCSGDPTCQELSARWETEARRSLEREFELARLIGALYGELSSLYESQLAKEVKLSRRVEIFEKQMGPLRQRYPKLEILKNVNNAEIMQLRLYLRELPAFQALFEQSGGDWGVFVREIGAIKERVEKNGGLNPFEMLPKLS